MKRTTKIILSIALVALASAAAYQIEPRWPHTISTNQLGIVRVFPAWWRQQGVMFVFSGMDGWSEPDEATAVRYARSGYYVVGIDAPRFLASMKEGCLYLPGLLEAYSREQQRGIGTRNYQEPVLLGRGVGASLVYMAQLQAPPLAFSAAVALNPVPQLAASKSFCDHTAVSATPQTQTLRPEPPNQAVPLRMWADDHAAATTRDFVATVTAALPRFAPSTTTLYATYQAALDDIAIERLQTGVADLPLVEVQPKQTNSAAFAILYSGDGGWRDLDQRLAGVLADKGMSVVGVDTLRYYWHEKSPQRGADDLARIIRYYRKTWHRDQVVLIGFSLGANVMPFLFNRLPQELRSQVQLISLLSPERTTAFAVDPTNWLHIHTDSGKTAIAPELQPIAPNLVQCIYGQDEGDDSLCTMTAAAKTQVLRKSGGHHFDENYDQLADDILGALHGSR